jgi:hypothetical protein
VSDLARKRADGVIDPDGETLRTWLWSGKAAVLLGTHRADAILASGHVRLHQQAGHLSASDPIKTLSNTLARRGPST